VSGETVIVPEGEPIVERGRDFCPRTGLLLYCIRCPIREWQAACVYSSGGVIMLLRLDMTAILLVTMLLCHCVG
jgi:hypothetical protein